MKPILFLAATNQTLDVQVTVTETALRLGWTVLGVPRLSPIGLPCLRAMYATVADRYPDCAYHAYTNGDILFDRGLAHTMHAVAKVRVTG